MIRGSRRYTALLRNALALSAAATLLGATGCVTRPPTIAHVHIGHAITGVHVTPDHEGYLSTAERQARDTLELSKKALGSQDLTQIKADIAAAVKATDSEDEFSVKHALVMAANHLSFAATSDDATLNLQQSAPIFVGHTTRVVERCELIALLGKDVAASTSVKEATVSVQEVVKLADANVSGDDSNGDGIVGSDPSEFGLLQLRKELEAMIARERPAYVTVDRWYLFNLVRLPSGRWVFDKLSRGGNIEGYK